jgi:hypothetical protein
MFQIIGHIKAATKISQLNQDSPWEFAVYLRYCRLAKHLLNAARKSCTM